MNYPLAASTIVNGTRTTGPQVADMGTLAGAVRTAAYYVQSQYTRYWIDACRDAAEMHGVCIHAVADALRAAGHPVPTTI